MSEGLALMGDLQGGPCQTLKSAYSPLYCMSLLLICTCVLLAWVLLGDAGG